MKSLDEGRKTAFLDAFENGLAIEKNQRHGQSFQWKETVSELDTRRKTEVFMGKEYILSNENIRNFTDTTPFSEGDLIGFLEDGDGGGFWLAAEEVAVASAVQAAKLTTGQARALFQMRSFYFLGVLRGAEEYRAMLTDDMETENAPFSLDGYASEEFRESLEAMDPEDFRRLCALLGLSVEWEDSPSKRRKR